MLTQQTAKTLGYKKQFRHSIQNPSFVKQGTLWKKSKCELPIHGSIFHKKHMFTYSKFGRTFGFETKRYIEYSQEGILFYFDGDNDSEYKGYCITENLYMYYIPVGNQQLMHLTNGTQSSQFYFNDHKFYNHVQAQLLKDVIQLNFYEKYSLIELLGKGTYSKVYLAKNKENMNKYAAKVVLKKDKNGSCTKTIVDEEKKILALLNSEYVCRMEQFFEDNDSYIFVLEYITGQDLMSIFREKTEISVANLVMIFKNVLYGLAHIHSKGILHRDLKPQNIMINETTMSPKLIDFGLSLICGASTDKKRFKRCGTMGYMAFQVINNSNQKKKKYDHKCDMFSFGIIAYMMLMGFNPLKGANYNETVKKNQECNIELDTNGIIQKYGIRGLEFLRGLLQKEAAQRWSAEEALKSDFIRQEFFNDHSHSIIKPHIEEPTEEKQDEAQFQQEDQQITIPKFQTFVPKKINLDSRNFDSN